MVKDESKLLREPTEEEAKYYCKPRLSMTNSKQSVGSASSFSTNNSSNLHHSESNNSINNLFPKEKSKTSNYKEKGIVIKVVKGTNDSKKEIIEDTVEKKETYF